MTKLLYARYMAFLYLIILTSLSFTQYYNVDLNETGESHLVVFLDSIEGLSPGDEIGIFDLNGVIETVETGETPQYGEVLVGSAVWDGETNGEGGSVTEAAAIMSVDLSDFGGPVLNGAVMGNNVIIKVRRNNASQTLIV